MAFSLSVFSYWLARFLGNPIRHGDWFDPEWKIKALTVTFVKLRLGA
jgi:hypothetical protein